MSLLKDMGRTCLYPMPAGCWVPQSPWCWVVEGGALRCWRGTRTGVSSSLALPLVSQLGLEVLLHQRPQGHACSPVPSGTKQHPCYSQLPVLS